MGDFPSCFGKNGVQIADSSSSTSTRNSQNTVTCVYQTHKSITVTITWSKTLIGQGFSVGVDHQTHKVEMKPWLLSKKKGSKSFETHTSKVSIFWNLTTAKFGTGPEPLEGFYVALVFDGEMVLLLGDMKKEAFKKSNVGPPISNAMLISKKEHVFGRSVYCTRAKFSENGKVHDVVIDCETVGLKDPFLEIRIDCKRVVQVNRLSWKFRGNQTILVDGLPVEVFWDVFSWLFGGSMANAVFMFQTCLSSDKLLSWSCSQSFREAQLQGLGFSLVLHAWRNE